MKKGAFAYKTRPTHASSFFLFILLELAYDMTSFYSLKATKKKRQDDMSFAIIEKQFCTLAQILTIKKATKKLGWGFFTIKNHF